MTRSPFIHLILLAGFMVSPAQAVDARKALPATVADVVVLDAHASYQLALSLIDQTQPPRYDLAPADWLSWEMQRLEVLRHQEDWSLLQARIDAYPAGLPNDFILRTMTLRAEVLLARGEAAAAQSLLAGLVWGAAASAPHLPSWRALLIRSYLQQGHYDDAVTALIRYRQDYGSSDLANPQVMGRVLLLARREGEAVTLLSGEQSNEARALYVLAQVRSQTGGSVSGQVRDRLVDSKLPAEVRALYWQALREDAAQRRDNATLLAALESLWLIAPEGLPKDGLYSLTREDLWQAYQSYAEQLSNDAELLVGDEEGWLALAARLRSSSPMQARAIYVTLSRLAEVPEHRAQAELELLTLFQQHRQLLAVLYLGSAQAPAVHGLSQPLQVELIRLLVVSGEFVQASQLIQQLDGVISPGDVDNLLLAGRAHGLAGNAALAGPMLEQLCQNYSALTPAQQLSLHELLDDLGRAGEQRLVLTLLLSLRGVAEEAGLSAQIASQLQAMYRPADAARYYLLAAGKTTDLRQQWQYRELAAGALAQAGLIADARRQYQWLLGQVTEPARKTELQDRLSGLR